MKVQGLDPQGLPNCPTRSNTSPLPTPMPSRGPSGFALVSRLDRDDVGAATGYRWFVPVKPTIPNLPTTSINASMGMFLGSKNPNIVWAALGDSPPAF